jgi:hypothetical protein
VEEREIRRYLKLRREIQSLLPGVFIEIRDLVKTRVGVEGTVGEFDRERAMTLFPELGLNVPVDWVAFGFAPQPFYDVHIGVILETQEWPVMCHTGLHVSATAWPSLEHRVARIDWQAMVGAVPDHTIAGNVREHRFCDPSRRFDFADPHREAEVLADRAAAYYHAARDHVAVG